MCRLVEALVQRVSHHCVHAAISPWVALMETKPHPGSVNAMLYQLRYTGNHSPHPGSVNAMLYQSSETGTNRMNVLYRSPVDHQGGLTSTQTGLLYCLPEQHCII